MEDFSQFLKEKQYLGGVSAKTLSFYQQCLTAFKRYGGDLTEEGKKAFIINMKEAGLSVGAINSYVRGLNSYLSWKGEPRVKLLKAPKKVLSTFTEEDIKKIVSYKATGYAEKRLQVLLLTLVDTGCRIEEILGLKRNSVDFDNLLVTVRGKGDKDRIIPISIEVRKILYKLLQTHSFELCFCTRSGHKVSYDNLRRDFLKLLDKLDIKKPDLSFHAFRRFFARNYVKNGGNLFYLQRCLGHSSLTMSRHYVEEDVEDLQATHLKTSVLGRLR